MNIVITMAGSGERFRRAGYDRPKFMLRARGQSLFHWSMASLANIWPHCEKLIFIVRDEHDPAAFISDELVSMNAPDPIFVPLAEATDGQATTAIRANTIWDAAAPLLIYNIDTYVDPRFIGLEQIRGDGWIPCFRAPGSHWSFVRLDKHGHAAEVREKERISDFASIGLYWFGSADLYEWAYESHYDRGPGASLRERYIAPIYNDLIAAGHEVTISDVPVQAVVPLGTPDELTRFDAASAVQSRGPSLTTTTT